jgi:ureidoglycolate dehydrogenase (NAD+)
MRRVQAEELAGYCTRILTSLGVPEEDAATVADGLVTADLRGVASHGVMRLPIYVTRLRQGLVSPRPLLHLERTGPATAVLDGGNGFGHVVATHAMRHAVAIAREAGAATVAVRRSNHFGTAGWYAARAAEQGMIGWAVTHSEADVIPFGGRAPALGTNPLAIAAPASGGPVVLDMATSIVAMGRVLRAAQQGQAIPGDWAVDADGNPTTDPDRARAVRPMAGPKGYGLAVMIDLLVSGLSGSAFGTGIRRMYDDFEHPQEVGHLLGAIDIVRFVPLEEFREHAGRLTAALKAVPPAAGAAEVLLPGEPEDRAEQRNRADGVPLDEQVWASLSALGSELGVGW